MSARGKEPLGTSVAGPLTHFSRETYNGAELASISPRPGAYDAYRLPSLFNGRQRTPAPIAAPAAAPAFTTRAAVATWAPIPEPVVEEPPLRDPPELRRAITSTATYRPRRNGAPARLIAALNHEGGHLTYTQISQRFGLARDGIAVIFARAVEHGLLVRHSIGIEAAFSLPGYLPRDSDHPSTPVSTSAA